VEVFIEMTSPDSLTEMLQSIVGIGGIAVAALGIWIAHKARQSPFHEVLYARQLEASADLAKLVVDICFWAALADPQTSRKDFDAELRKKINSLVIAHTQYGIVLPPAVLRGFLHFLNKAIDVVDSGMLVPGQSNDASQQLSLAADELVLVMRNALGVGGISKQVERFFSAVRERHAISGERKEIAPSATRSAELPKSSE
jgi:hypothetical protein